MNRVVLAKTVGVLGAVCLLASACSPQGRKLEAVEKDLAQAKTTLEGTRTALTNSRALIEALEKKVGQLTTVLTNSTAQLSAARGRVQVLEAEAAWKANAEAPGPQTEEARRSSARYAPTVTASSSRDGYVPGRSVLFTNLYGKNDLVLAANVECTGVYGRRVAFKETTSTKRMAFDVDELHPEVLRHLGVNADAQKAIRAQQEAVWQRVGAAQLAMAVAAEAQRKAELEAQAAAQAEAEKQMAEEADRRFQRDLQIWALQNDTVKANAAMRSADAAILHALNPPLVPVAPVVPVPPRW